MFRTPDPESDYDYLFYHQNELCNSLCRSYKTDHMLPTINYVNERNCPIYVHEIRHDSNSYDEWFLSHNQKNTAKPPLRSYNNHKNILDKLEESYWATWKPKKSILSKPILNFVSLNVGNFCGFSDIKPMFQEQKVMHQQEFSKSTVNVNDITKYFKVKHFKTSNSDTVDEEDFSRTSSKDFEITGNEKLAMPGDPCRMRDYKQHSVCQEIQTETHDVVILQECRDQVLEEESKFAPVFEEDLVLPKIKARSRKSKGKRNTTKNTAEPCNSLQPFVEDKNSIKIMKKKQEQEEAKEHFKQHKCIRLYRKSGGYTGYIKGGTYTLRSCMKNEGSFKLGPPGSTLFITYSSFLNKKRF